MVKTNHPEPVVKIDRRRLASSDRLGGRRRTATLRLMAPAQIPRAGSVSRCGLRLQSIKTTAGKNAQRRIAGHAGWYPTSSIRPPWKDSMARLRIRNGSCERAINKRAINKSAIKAVHVDTASRYQRLLLPRQNVLIRSRVRYRHARSYPRRDERRTTSMRLKGLTLQPCLIPRQVAQRLGALARLIALKSGGQHACTVQLGSSRMTIGTRTAEKQQIAHGVPHRSGAS
jgi:hypothetical protein